MIRKAASLGAILVLALGATAIARTWTGEPFGAGTCDVIVADPYKNTVQGVKQVGVTAEFANCTAGYAYPTSYTGRLQEKISGTWVTIAQVQHTTGFTVTSGQSPMPTGCNDYRGRITFQHADGTAKAYTGLVVNLCSSP